MALFRRFHERSFVRNVAAVAGGTAAAQAIGMLFSPLITRLYGPEAVGIQGVFVSLAGLFSVVASLSFSRAIILPRSDIEALAITKLTMYITLVFSGLAAIVLYVFGTPLLVLFKAQSIASFVLLIPFAMAINVLGLALGQWYTRKKAFVVTSRLGVYAALVIGGIKVAWGAIQATPVALIATNLFGAALGIALTFFGWRRAARKVSQAPLVDTTLPGTQNLWTLALRYRDFPLFATPQLLLNASAQSLPLLVLASGAGAAAAGQYSIVITVLGVPTSLIGGSVMNVFYPRIIDGIHAQENVRALIAKATAGLAVTGIFPFAIVCVAGPTLFGFVFGAKWLVAGVYARWLAPMLFLDFLSRPAVSAIAPLRVQGALLTYEVVSGGMKLLGLWAGFHFFHNDIWAIALYSVVGSVMNVALIAWVLKRSAEIDDLRDD